MKIATWNIGGGFISKNNNLDFNEENLDYFVEEIKKINPDIICLQETHTSENTNQPKEIAKKLGYNYFRTKKVSDSHLKINQKLSLAIISKFPITDSKIHKLPNPNMEFIWRNKKVMSHDKIIFETRIKYNDKIIKVFSGQMSPFRKFGRDFLEDDFSNIRNKIEKIILKEKMPTIFCADMNFNGDIKKLLPNVFEKKFQAVLNNKPTTPKGRTYDKIIVSKEWTKLKSKIVVGKADHYLCVADLNLFYAHN